MYYACDSSISFDRVHWWTKITMHDCYEGCEIKCSPRKLLPAFQLTWTWCSLPFQAVCVSAEISIQCLEWHSGQCQIMVDKICFYCLLQSRWAEDLWVIVKNLRFIPQICWMSLNSTTYFEGYYENIKYKVYYENYYDRVKNGIVVVAACAEAVGIHGSYCYADCYLPKLNPKKNCRGGIKRGRHPNMYKTYFQLHLKQSWSMTVSLSYTFSLVYRPII